MGLGICMQHASCMLSMNRPNRMDLEGVFLQKGHVGHCEQGVYIPRTDTNLAIRVLGCSASLETHKILDMKVHQVSTEK